MSANDIVLAMDRPVISTGLKIATVRRSDLPALLVQRVIRLRPAIDRKFFLANLQSQPFIAHLTAEAKGGGVPHVSEGQIKDFVFPLPPLTEQKRISEALERVISEAHDSLAIVEVSIRRCARLRLAILKWAFEGRLVDQYAADEPASALLERIGSGRKSSAAYATPAKRRGSKSRSREA